MCGRFVSATPPGILADRFSVDEVVVPARPLPKRWNVAPTDETLAVAEHSGVRKLGVFRWGLIPTWADDGRDAARRINARAETVVVKPAFRDAFARRRCIVPADGFYEWRAGDDGRKQAYFIGARDGAPLAFAGLWSVWTPRPPSDLRLFDDGIEPDPVRSCTIVTTNANETMAPLHDRMPVILPPDAWDEWLDRTFDDVVALQHLLVPARDDILEIRAVGPDVNDVRRDGPHLVEAVR
ncbi:MAG: hypothetical protein QOK28_1765 [Actinomycetota bacterium]|jgi:putative SOS response-associated peptidase YedK